MCIRDRGYTGKMPKIYLRKVMFNKNNIAIKVIKSEGNPLSPTEGICKVYSNSVSYTHLDVYKRQVMVSPEREMEGLTADEIIKQILESIEIPR